MELVRVWTDVGARKPVALLAKIIERHGVISTIRYLSEGPDNIWRYEDDTYEIDDDSIAEHLGTDQESAIGFRVFDEDGFVREDSDDDYVLEDSSEDDDTDEDEVESGTEDEEEDLDEESDSEESLGEE
jgi:hypothetical protein